MLLQHYSQGSHFRDSASITSLISFYYNGYTRSRWKNFLDWDDPIELTPRRLKCILHTLRAVHKDLLPQCMRTTNLKSMWWNRSECMTDKIGSVCVEGHKMLCSQWSGEDHQEAVSDSKCVTPPQGVPFIWIPQTASSGIDRHCQGIGLCLQIPPRVLLTNKLLLHVYKERWGTDLCWGKSALNSCSYQVAMQTKHDKRRASWQETAEQWLASVRGERRGLPLIRNIVCAVMYKATVTFKVYEVIFLISQAH